VAVDSAAVAVVVSVVEDFIVEDFVVVVLAVLAALAVVAASVSAVSALVSVLSNGYGSLTVWRDNFLKKKFIL